MPPHSPSALNSEPKQPTRTRVQTAVILAAGKGMRLGARGRLGPKGCLRLGEKTIVEESVLRLLAVGIKRIVIVTGHLAEHYQPLRERFPHAVELVHNPHFGDSGSMYSLFCARHLLEEDFLLLESDLVYERRALTHCLDQPDDDVVLLSGFSKSSDECFVETQQGNLVAISKDRASLGSEATGELVGICKISQALFANMLEIAEQAFLTTRHMCYEMDCLILAAKHRPISCPVIEDLIWCEIDDESHLADAQREVYPIIHRQDLESNFPKGLPFHRKLALFKTIGFFDERDLIIRYLHDLFSVVKEHQIRACIMFGTLLGKLRHNDLIPWDDDLDIVVFDFDAFQEHCVPLLERQGYTVEADVREGKRMGCRIFREDSAKVPGKAHLRFPWIGIWEHEVGVDGRIALPPEEFRYRQEDFFPIQQAAFLGAMVGVPHNPTAILNTYFGSNDWMDVCQLPYRDHRQGGALTGYPKDKFNLQTVLGSIAPKRVDAPRVMSTS